MTHINNTGWLIIGTSTLSLTSLFPGLHVLQVWQSLYRSYHLWLLDNLNYNNSSPAQVSLTILSNIMQPSYNNYGSMLLTYTWNEHMIIWHQYKIFWTINYNNYYVCIWISLSTFCTTCMLQNFVLTAFKLDTVSRKMVKGTMKESSLDSGWNN